MLGVDPLAVFLYLDRPDRPDPAPSGGEGKAADASEEVAVGHFILLPLGAAVFFATIPGKDIADPIR